MKLYQKLCAAALLTGSSLVNAGVITETGTIDTSTDVDYFSFTMDSASTVTIDVWAKGYNGSNLDSYIYLYQPDVNGAYVTSNDDDWNAAAMTDGTTHGFDSYISHYLAAGDYTLAIGAFFLSDANARDGVNENGYTSGDYQITFTGTGLATAVSEPGSIALFGLGLVGLGFARRRQS